MDKTKGIVYTDEEKCVGCNKCIAVCPVDYANTIYLKKGKKRIHVDSKRCIKCGHCIEVCDHDARKYHDDTEEFIAALKRGGDFLVLAAPAIRFNFKNYRKLFGYLKKRGVNLFYDFSLGADITTWAYLKAIKDMGLNTIVAQPCPPVVNFATLAVTAIARILPGQCIIRLRIN